MTRQVLPMATTSDRFLDGTILIEQPALGYRAAIDPVLLAATIAPQPGQKLLDAGAGVGVASLCLAARVTSANLTALERDPAIASLLERNVAANAGGADIQAICGDLFDRKLQIGPFDQVFSNPPFLAAAKASHSPDPLKNSANILDHGDLEAWIKACLARLAPKGLLTLILRADHLDQAITAFANRAGGVSVLPLWPRADQPAKRIILRARKGSRAPLRLLPGLILHEADGQYTPAADDILRGRTALAFNDHA
jgi:tRNA1(Val) A37 N6-methylase TrmN6